MNDEIRDVAAIAVIVVLILLIVVGFVRLCNEASLPGEIAQIEQLRKDAGRIGMAAGEDVMGQVTQWNQDIASNQRYLRVWWGRIVTPRGWADVRTIDVLEGAR